MNLRLFTLAMTVFLAVTLLASPCTASAGSKRSTRRDLSGVVKSAGVNPGNSALLIVRLEDSAEWTSGGPRVETVYPPASTSKIPHTLIALELGYADGPSTPFTWDGQERSLEAWNQDQTLSSAFKCSALWVYQQITRDLGYEMMSQWIDRLEYGNRKIGTPENIATYWLQGPLATSARDQVSFLSKLAREILPLATDTFHVGKQIMQEARGENWSLYGKTGWWSDGENTGIGWYVGWLQFMGNDLEQTYVFAFNMDIGQSSELPLRQAVVRSALVAILLDQRHCSTN